MLESQEGQAGRNLWDLWVGDTDLSLDTSPTLNGQVGVNVARIYAVPALEDTRVDLLHGRVRSMLAVLIMNVVVCSLFHFILYYNSLFIQ